MTCHTFEDSGDAYNAVQCRDDIKNGDLLVIDFAGEWRGARHRAGLDMAGGRDGRAQQLHTIKDDGDPAENVESLRRVMIDARWTRSQVLLAVTAALRRGWAVSPTFLAWAEEVR